MSCGRVKLGAGGHVPAPSTIRDPATGGRAATARLTPLLVALVTLWAAAGGVAQAEEDRHAVTASFLTNLARFTTWPEHAFADTASPLEICVLGEVAFADALVRLAAIVDD